MPMTQRTGKRKTKNININKNFKITAFGNLFRLWISSCYQATTHTRNPHRMEQFTVASNHQLYYTTNRLAYWLIPTSSHRSTLWRVDCMWFAFSLGSVKNTLLRCCVPVHHTPSCLLSIHSVSTTQILSNKPAKNTSKQIPNMGTSKNSALIIMVRNRQPGLASVCELPATAVKTGTPNDRMLTCLEIRNPN